MVNDFECLKYKVDYSKLTNDLELLKMTSSIYGDTERPLSYEIAEDIFKFQYANDVNKIGYFGLGRISHLLILGFFQKYIVQNEGIITIDARIQNQIFGTVRDDKITLQNIAEDEELEWHYEEHANNYYAKKSVSELFLPDYAGAPFPYVMEGVPYDSIFTHLDMFSDQVQELEYFQEVFDSKQPYAMQGIKTFIFIDYNLGEKENKALDFLLNKGCPIETKTYYLKDRKGQQVYSLNTNKPMVICNVHYLKNNQFKKDF